VSFAAAIVVTCMKANQHNEPERIKPTARLMVMKWPGSRRHIHIPLPRPSPDVATAQGPVLPDKFPNTSPSEREIIRKLGFKINRGIVDARLKQFGQNLDTPQPQTQEGKLSGALPPPGQLTAPVMTNDGAEAMQSNQTTGGDPMAQPCIARTSGAKQAGGSHEVGGPEPAPKGIPSGKSEIMTSPKTVEQTQQPQGPVMIYPRGPIHFSPGQPVRGFSIAEARERGLI